MPPETTPGPASGAPPARSPRRGAPGDALWALALALPQILLPVLFGAFHGAPMNDGWSYARVAEALARTGHLQYNGWGSPAILPQAALGALLIRAFGFSYVPLAWFGAVCGAAAAAALFLLARACGCSRGSAAAVVALVTLNPIFLGLAPTFMTETFSLLLLLLSLLFLVRSLRPMEDGASAGRVAPAWGGLAAAAVFGFLAGANRQILWVAFLGALAALTPFTPRREALRRLLPAFVAVAAAAAVVALWFNRQPYVVVADYRGGMEALSRYPVMSLVWAFRALALLGLLVFPFALAALLMRGRPVRYLLLVALLVFCLFPPLFLFREAGFDTRFRLTEHGQYFTDSGILVRGVAGFATRPVAMLPPLPAVFTFLGAVGMALGFYLLMEWAEDASALLRRRQGGGGDGGDTTPGVSEAAALSAVAASGVAQVAASLLWYMSGNVFDRYHLLIWPGLLILHARQLDLALARPATSGGPAPLLSSRRLLVGLFAGLIGVLGIAFAQEYMGYSRARAELFRRLTDDGVARKAIDAGYELNADTQVLEEGRANHPSVTNPPGAHDPTRRGTARFLPDQFPAIVAEYRLSSEYPPTVEETGLVDPEPVDRYEYESLLPPNRRAVYVYRVRKDEEAAALAATGRLPGQR